MRDIDIVANKSPNTCKSCSKEPTTSPQMQSKYLPGASLFAIWQEVVMGPIVSLSASVTLLFLISVGCGNPSHNPNVANGPLRVITSSPPSITNLLPSSSPVNAVPFTLEIDGTNFDTNAVVYWDGSPLSTTFVSSQQLFADLASTNLMLAGTIKVYVRTDGLNSNTVEFDLH